MATLMKRKGSPFWYARFSVNGKDTWVSTKKKTRNEAKSVADNEEKQKKGLKTIDDSFRELVGLIEKLGGKEQTHKRHELAGQLLAGQVSTVRIRDAWQMWLNSPSKGNPGESTIRIYGFKWKQFEEWAVERKLEYMHQVTPLLAQEYAAKVWATKVTPNTFNSHVKFLDGLFRVLEEKAGLGSNPWRKVKRLKKETQGRHNFTSEELATICSKATGDLRYMIALGLYTGMRLGDVVNLRWKDIGKHTIEIMPMKTRRTGKRITVPIHPVLRALLDELQSNSKTEHLFPEQAAQYKRHTARVAAVFQKFLESCGIQIHEKATGHRQMVIVRKGFHSLRHSFVSLCAANRVPQVAIQDLVGHGSPAMTALYAHADQEQRQKAIESLPAVVFSEKT